LLANNPFLAKYEKKNAVNGKNNNRMLRRKTISNPYEHIQKHQYAGPSDNCAPSRENQGFHSDANQIHNSGPKFESGDSQTASPEQMKIISHAAQTTSRKIGNRADRQVLIVPEISSNVIIGSSDDGEYDCLVARRPIRLPLRKHHTFHFQNTQTANGKLCELRELLQLQMQERAKFEQEEVPLVIGPVELSEQHAFKPISPTPTLTASAEQKTRYQNQNDFPFSQNEDDEDLGYSFCEEECMVDSDNYPTSDNRSTAPASNSITSKAI